MDDDKKELEEELPKSGENSDAGEKSPFEELPGFDTTSEIIDNENIDLSLLEKLRSNKKLSRFLHAVIITLITFLSVIFILVFVLYFVPFMREYGPDRETAVTNNKELKQDPEYKKLITLTNRDIQRLSLKYNAHTSGQSYIVINTTGNRFYLYRNKQLVREGFCSTGSYQRLQTATGKSWTFKTPRGRFTIQGKRTHPAWHRPDWSFIEEGVVPPPEDSPLRWEAGVLGDYAMDLGDSYMIHGTIYKRFLGMPVTHGCVRLNDEDLKVIFNTLSIGSKVYIF